MVGIVEGEKEVDVSKGYVINFAVDKKPSSIAKCTWHDEDDPVCVPDPEFAPSTEAAPGFLVTYRAA